MVDRVDLELLEERLEVLGPERVRVEFGEQLMQDARAEAMVQAVEQMDDWLQALKMEDAPPALPRPRPVWRGLLALSLPLAALMVLGIIWLGVGHGVPMWDNVAPESQTVDSPGVAPREESPAPAIATDDEAGSSLKEERVADEAAEQLLSETQQAPRVELEINSERETEVADRMGEVSRTSRSETPLTGSVRKKEAIMDTESRALEADHVVSPRNDKRGHAAEPLPGDLPSPQVALKSQESARAFSPAASTVPSTAARAWIHAFLHAWENQDRDAWQRLTGSLSQVQWLWLDDLPGHTVERRLFHLFRAFRLVQYDLQDEDGAGVELVIDVEPRSNPGEIHTLSGHLKLRFDTHGRCVMLAYTPR